MDTNLRKCPFCGEHIQKDALKCKFCKECINQTEKDTSNLNPRKKTPLSKNYLDAIFSAISLMIISFIFIFLDKDNNSYIYRAASFLFFYNLITLFFYLRKYFKLINANQAVKKTNWSIILFICMGVLVLISKDIDVYEEEAINDNAGVVFGLVVLCILFIINTRWGIAIKKIQNDSVKVCKPLGTAIIFLYPIALILYGISVVNVSAFLYIVSAIIFHIPTILLIIFFLRIQKSVESKNINDNNENTDIHTNKSRNETCYQCGNQIDISQSFCTHCGNKIIPDESVNANPSNIQNKTLNQSKIPRKTNVWKWITITLFIILGIIILTNTLISTEEESPLKVISYNFTPLEVNEDVIPVVCSYFINNETPLFEIEIANNSYFDLEFVVKAEIPEYSLCSENTFSLASEESNTFTIPIIFNKTFYQNNEKIQAQLNINIIQNDKTIYIKSLPINIASKGTMLWTYYDSKNNEISLMDLVACFVTPHDPVIEEIIADAKELKDNRAFMGYQLENRYEQEFETKEEMKAVFLALRNNDLSYVHSPITFTRGTTQTIRTPSESFKNKQANCIDGAVLFASLFESINLEPCIIIGPGHAFVAVRKTKGSSECYFLETTMTGQVVDNDIDENLNDEESFWYLLFGLSPKRYDIFEEALKEGERKFNKWFNEKTFYVIDIKKCRENNIYPAF